MTYICNQNKNKKLTLHNTISLRKRIHSCAKRDRNKEQGCAKPTSLATVLSQQQQIHTGVLKALLQNGVLEEKFVLKEEFGREPSRGSVVSRGIFSPAMREKLKVVCSSY